MGTVYPFFSLALLSMGVMGSGPVTCLIYTWLTMANNENLKLTVASRNASQKNNLLTSLALTRTHL